MERILKYFPGLDSGKADRLRAMKDLYMDWNAKINVISRKDMEFFYLHHVLHSLAIAALYEFKPGCRVADVGCGGGFPSVPLAVLFPEVSFTGIDSVGKKITVLKNVAAALELKNVTALNARVEQLPAGLEFDFIASRAVTAFPDFVKLVKGRLSGSAGKAVSRRDAGQVKSGILYLKGGDFADELKSFPKAEVTDLSSLFCEDFFETKKLIYLPF